MATKTRKPAPATPAPAPAPAPAEAKKAPAPKRITILNAEPKLRGSRAARWPLVLASKDAHELAAALKAGGHKQSAAGTLRWLVTAKIVSLD